jgi:hypothetical protein
MCTYLVTPSELIKLVGTGYINYVMENTRGKDGTYHVPVSIQWNLSDAQHDNLTWACGLECEELGLFMRSRSFLLKASNLLPHVQQKHTDLHPQSDFHPLDLLPPLPPLPPPSPPHLSTPAAADFSTPHADLQCPDNNEHGWNLPELLLTDRNFFDPGALLTP